MSRSDVSRWVLVVEAPTRSTPLVTLPEVYNPDPKNAPHNLYRVPLHHLSVPPTPQFSVFHPLFKKFFAQSRRRCPPCAESPRRTLAQPKTPGIPRQNRPYAPRRHLKITRKTPLQNPKTPTPHAPPHKKIE